MATMVGIEKLLKGLLYRTRCHRGVRLVRLGRRRNNDILPILGDMTSPKVWDMYVRDRHIDTLKVKARNFQ